MALTFYRGNVNLPNGGDPIAEVSAALRERRLRQQQLQDRTHNEAAELERQRQNEQNIRERMLQVHQLDNEADLQRALATRKDAQAARAEAQRKAIPGIQAHLGKGDADAARAAALAAGIDNFGEVAPARVERDFGDSVMEMGASVQPLPDPNAPKKFGFSVGDQRQEFALAKPADNTAVAATMDIYLNDPNPEIRKLAGVVRAQTALGKLNPGKGLSMLSNQVARLRGQDVSAANSRRSVALGGQRLALDTTKADRQVDKGDATANRQTNQFEASYNTLRGQMKRYDDLLSTGKAVPYLKDSQERKTAQKMIMVAVKNFETMGALDKGVSDVVDDILGGSTMADLAPETARAKVAEAMRYIELKHRETLKSVGREPAPAPGQPASAAPRAKPKSEDDMIDEVLRQAGYGK